MLNHYRRVRNFLRKEFQEKKQRFYFYIFLSLFIIGYITPIIARALFIGENFDYAEYRVMLMDIQQVWMMMTVFVLCVVIAMASWK